MLGEEEVRYCSDLMNVFRSPEGIPPFLKRRRKTSRPLTLASDYARLIQSQAEKDFFLRYLPDFTFGTKVNFTSFLLAYNRTLIESWGETKVFSDLYLKNERDLRKYSTALLAQAGAHEVARLNTVQGLVEAARVPAQPAGQPAVPPLPDVSHFRETDEGGRGGHGRGGKGRSLYCDSCQAMILRKYNCSVAVPKKGHHCAAALIYAGFDPKGPLVSGAAGFQNIKPGWGRDQALAFLRQKYHRAVMDGQRHQRKKA
jgi:hypothetical protein